MCSPRRTIDVIEFPGENRFEFVGENRHSDEKYLSNTRSCSEFFESDAVGDEAEQKDCESMYDIKQHNYQLQMQVNRLQRNQKSISNRYHKVKLENTSLNQTVLFLEDRVLELEARNHTLQTSERNRRREVLERIDKEKRRVEECVTKIEYIEHQNRKLKQRVNEQEHFMAQLLKEKCELEKQIADKNELDKEFSKFCNRTERVDNTNVNPCESEAVIDEYRRHLETLVSSENELMKKIFQLQSEIDQLKESHRQDCLVNNGIVSKSFHMDEVDFELPTIGQFDRNTEPISIARELQ